MTITMIALFSSALFLIPAFLMPHNRLRAIIISLLPGVFILTGLYFCDLFFVSIDLNTKIGTIFLPMWNPFFQGFEELSLVEKHHFSTTFTYLFIYLVSFIISNIFTSYFFIGSNPSIRRPIRWVHRAFDIVVFIIFTYGVWFLFLAEIRLLLPFPDGFLSPLYQWIYPLEA